MFGLRVVPRALLYFGKSYETTPYSPDDAVGNQVRQGNVDHPPAAQIEKVLGRKGVARALAMDACDDVLSLIVGMTTPLGI